MSHATRIAVLVLAAAATARAAPEQLTASAGDSSAQRLGPSGSGFAAVRSNGDLTPGQPGNVDGSTEVYFLRLTDGSIVQVTNSAANSSAARVTAGGLVVVSSNGDLTPGQPGNPDGSFEGWLFAPGAVGPVSLLQMTSSVEDSFFQTFWDDGNRAFFVSKGDLTPGAPGNSDGGNEVFSYDVATHALTQLTNSAGASVITAVCVDERCGVIESTGDLVPGAPGNADGSTEVYLIDLDTRAFTQVTASAGVSEFCGRDPSGRYLAIDSTGDLVAGGNADGSNEVFVYDRSARTTTQLTASSGDSFFQGFVPGSRLVAVESRQNLAPATSSSRPGNPDGSREVFTVDRVTRRIVQRTASAGDSAFEGFANARGGLAAIESNGDLSRRTAAVGVNDVWLLDLRAKRPRPRRITRGAQASSVAGFDGSGRFLVLESKADLVSGGNADGTSEMFVARTKRKPKVRQLTSSAANTTFAGFTGARSFVVNSRGNLDPTGPGNTDGSLEVFRVDF